MSFSVTCLLKKQNRILTVLSIRNRSQKKNLGKPPGLAKTLKERMEGTFYLYNNTIIVYLKLMEYQNNISEMNLKDPKVHFKVDIGLPMPERDRKLETSKRIEYIKKIKCNPELEKLARNNKCKFLKLFLNTKYILEHISSK